MYRLAGLLAGVLVDLLAANTVVFERELVVFAKRVADPIFGTENAFRIGMPQEVRHC